MPNVRQPRSGSMEYWPRKRAQSEVVRVRSWGNAKDAKPLGFAGYKVGMTHVLTTDNRKASSTKGMKVRIPVTVVECPNLKIIGARFYKNTFFGEKVATEVEFKSDNKRLTRRKNISKNPNSNIDAYTEKLSGYTSIRLLVHTMPDKTTIGKKTPEVFELGIGGSVEDQFNYVKEHQGTEISVADVFAAGEQMDIKAVSKGKGLQGPVKRFGIHVRAKKSEKTKRGPGSISGGWVAAGHMMYRVAHAGQMGYHKRTEHNKILLKVSDNPEEINPKGGFINYGEVKSTFIMIKGSVPGPKKRLIRFNKPLRANKLFAGWVPSIDTISLESQQGN